MTAPLTPRRPYLVRAMHEWMTDNGQTPHLVVDATLDGVDVPGPYVKDGKVILNVSWNATQGLRLGNDLVEFSARFGGKPHLVRIPIAAVLGIYSRETGQGMLFQEEEGGTPPPAASPPDTTPPGGPAPAGPKPSGGPRPRLRVVK